MSKEYRYRKHIRWGQYLVPMFVGFLILAFWGALGFLMINRATQSTTFLSSFTTSLIVILSVTTFILLLEGGFGWYLYYRLAGVVVSIGEDAVIYKYRGGEKRLPFESLRVESSSIRYTGGWLKLISGKDVVRLTVVVENIGEFVQELKAALDSRGLSSHYDSQKLFSFVKTAAYSDQSWERAYVVFGKLFLIICVVGITLANGYIFGTTMFGLTFVFLWLGFVTIWATGAYLIAEMKLGRKIAKESSGQGFTFPPRDLAYEKQVYNKAINWGGWLYILVSVLILVGALAFKMILFSLQ